MSSQLLVSIVDYTQKKQQTAGILVNVVYQIYRYYEYESKNFCSELQDAF